MNKEKLEKNEKLQEQIKKIKPQTKQKIEEKK